MFSIISTPKTNLTPEECKALFEEMTTILTNRMGMTAVGELTESSRTFRSCKSEISAVGPFSSSYVTSVTSNYEIVGLTLRGKNRDQIVLQVTDNSAHAKRPYVTLIPKPQAPKAPRQKGLAESVSPVAKSFVCAIRTMAEDNFLRCLLLGIVIGTLIGVVALFRNLTQAFPNMSTIKKILIVTVTLCTCFLIGSLIGRRLTRKD